MGEKKKLTPKEELFVKQYLIDYNATRAVKAAGYTLASESYARFYGHKLLTKPHIKAAVEKEKTKRLRKVDLDAQWVLHNMLKLYKQCTKGEPVLDRNGNPTGEWKMESRTAQDILKTLGKECDLFKEKSEVTHKFSLESLVVGSQNDGSSKKD